MTMTSSLTLILQRFGALNAGGSKYARHRGGFLSGHAGVGWSRETLGVSAQTVTGFELLGVDPKLSTLNKWYRALEGAGVERRRHVISPHHFRLSRG
jgi:hypothetical protein